MIPVSQSEQKQHRMQEKQRIKSMSEMIESGRRFSSKPAYFFRYCEIFLTLWDSFYTIVSACLYILRAV